MSARATNAGCLLCDGRDPPRGASCKMCGRAGRPARHECHAEGCGEEVPPRLLFCARHWRMTPARIRKAIWAEYVPGQEVKKNPTIEYLRVMKEAIEAVAKAEGRR